MHWVKESYLMGKKKNHQVSKASTQGKLMLNIHDSYIDILNSFSKIIKIRQVYIKKDNTRELYSSWLRNNLSKR